MTWPERRLLVRALCLLALTAAGLRAFGYRRTAAFLLPAPVSGQARQDLPAAQAVARVVQGAARWSPLAVDCLPRALVLCRSLARQGLGAQLHLGVTKSDGGFAAHAWVEHAGVALAEPEPPRQRFAAFPGASGIRGA
jgi:hypothetical protein